MIPLDELQNFPFRDKGGPVARPFRVAGHGCEPCPVPVTPRVELTGQSIELVRVLPPKHIAHAEPRNWLERVAHALGFTV